MMPSALLTTVVLLVLAQQPSRDAKSTTEPARDAVLYGRVTDEGGRGVAGAIVTVVDIEPGGARTALTDTDGRYTIGSLPPGRYPVVASKTGYPKTAYGQLLARGPGALVVLTAARRTEANITLLRGGVITGLVLDERGEPVPHTFVTASQWLDSGAVPQMITNARTMTDERGAFRLWSLAPGEYLVESGSRSENPTAPAAAKVKVAAGEERLVSIREIGVAAVNARVSGSVLGADGRVFRGVSVQLYHTAGTSTGGSVTTNDGAFTFREVPAGAYTIVARAWIHMPGGPGRVSSSTAYWAVDDVRVVDEQPVTVSLRLSEGTTLSGRIVPDVTSGAFDLSKFFLQLVRMDPPQAPFSGSLNVTKYPDGTFVFWGVPPGRYTMQIAGSPEHHRWTFRSAMVGPVDMLEFPISIGTDPVSGVVVTVSDRQTLLEGRVRNARGDTMPNVGVVVYPRDRRYWFTGSRRLALVRPDSDGSFSARGLPEGGYLVAVTSSVPESWQDPAFLARLSPVTTVSLREGARIGEDITVR